MKKVTIHMNSSAAVLLMMNRFGRVESNEWNYFSYILVYQSPILVI